MTDLQLVLLPGMDGTGILFEPLVQALPNGIRATVVSYSPEIPMTYEQLLPVVKESLPKQEPFVLLGESFSGPLAIMAASENPSNLRAVILCATFIRNPIPWLPSWFRHIALSPLFRFSRHFILAKALVAGYSAPELMILLRKAHLMVLPKVMATRARAILSVDVEPALKGIKVPIFFIGGTDDKVSPPQNLRDIVRVRQDVQISLISGPHLILQIKPKEAAALITTIVEKANRNLN